jgi:Rrf2 family iron-sulfur cluster assembly transcriptional regulator
LAYLGHWFGKRAVSLKEVALNEGVSEKYLERIFYQLTKAGLLVTKKGPGGGYELRQPPSAIKLIDILSAVGESFAPVFCVAENNLQACPRSRFCPARPYWQKLKHAQEEFFKIHTLADICQQSDEDG